MFDAHEPSLDGLLPTNYTPFILHQLPYELRLFLKQLSQTKGDIMSNIAQTKTIYFPRACNQVILLFLVPFLRSELFNY